MNPRIKRLLLPFAILGIFGIAVAAIMATKSPPQKKPKREVVPIVDTQTIKLQPIILKARSHGVIEPRFQTRLVAQVAGEVMEVSEAFILGGRLSKGDLLAQIDPFNYQVKVQQAEANLASARANFILERAQGRVAEAEWENISNATPSELGLRKPQQEQALAAVKAAEAALKQAQKDLERTEIRAPFDAIVKSRSISPGTYVNVGTLLGELHDISVAEVKLPVAQSELQHLVEKGIGATVDFRGSAFGRQSVWQGRVVRDSGIIDADNRMLMLIAEIPRPYDQQPPLPFGTYLSAEIHGRKISSAARIPRQSLKNTQAPLYQDGVIKFVDVVIAKHEDTQSIIEQGLQAGDQLIVSALDLSIDGMAVAKKGAARKTSVDKNDAPEGQP